MASGNLHVPQGYIKQELSDLTTKYIKATIMEKWINKRQATFGTRWSYIVCVNEASGRLERETESTRQTYLATSMY